MVVGTHAGLLESHQTMRDGEKGILSVEILLKHSLDFIRRDCEGARGSEHEVKSRNSFHM